MIRLNVPTLGPEEAQAAAEVLATGFLTQGPVTARFEARVAALAGARYGFATSSCTTALHLALVSLGIGPGDEVVVPDFTFPATINAVLQSGATPVIVDVLPGTWAMDPTLVADVIGPRTRAIMPVHPFGLPADMAALTDVAAGDRVAVIEDAACAIGAAYRGRPVGSLGDVAAFSFHPRKIVTTGEGGLLATDRDDVADRVAILRTHGARRGDLFLEFEEAGFNYRLSDVNAAIGLAQLNRLDGMLRDRRAAASGLNHRMLLVPQATPQVVPGDRTHTYQSYVVALDGSVERDEVVRRMRESGVETTLGTYSLHAQPAYRAVTYTGRGVGERAQRTTLTLPAYPGLTDDDLDTVTNALVAALAVRTPARAVRS